MKQIVIVFMVFSSVFYGCSNNTTGDMLLVSAKSLADDFKENPQAGVRKYRGKVLLVEGTVAEYYRNKKQEISVVLREKHQAVGVKCNLIRSSKQISKPLKYGQKLKIKGVCIGFNEDVLLENCFIVKSQ